MMKTSPDIRYESEGATLTSAAEFFFPLGIIARKQNHAAALAAGRAVIAQIESEAAALKIGAFRVLAGKIRFEYEQDQKNCVTIDLGVSLVLNSDAGASFWTRAEAISRTLDLIQKFVDQSKQGKDLIVYTNPARDQAEAKGGAN